MALAGSIPVPPGTCSSVHKYWRAGYILDPRPWICNSRHDAAFPGASFIYLGISILKIVIEDVSIMMNICWATDVFLKGHWSCLLDQKYLSRAMRKLCLMSYANNKGADLAAHPRSLISTFVVHCLDSIYNISRFYSWNFKTLASFCGCAGQFVSGLVRNSQRHVLSCCGSFPAREKDNLLNEWSFVLIRSNMVFISYSCLLQFVLLFELFIPLVLFVILLSIRKRQPARPQNVCK